MNDFYSHSKIEYLTFEKKLLDKCELAHNQREESRLADLKDIANLALDTGTKTEASLLKDLQQVTDLKVSHVKLDKDMEFHQIQHFIPTLETNLRKDGL